MDDDHDDDDDDDDGIIFYIQYIFSFLYRLDLGTVRLMG